MQQHRVETKPCSSTEESPLYTELRILGLKADDLVNLMAILNKHRGAHSAKRAAAQQLQQQHQQGRAKAVDRKFTVEIPSS